MNEKRRRAAPRPEETLGKEALRSQSEEEPSDGVERAEAEPL